MWKPEHGSDAGLCCREVNAVGVRFVLIPHVERLPRAPALFSFIPERDTRLVEVMWMIAAMESCILLR